MIRRTGDFQIESDEALVIGDLVRVPKYNSPGTEPMEIWRQGNLTDDGKMRIYDIDPPVSQDGEEWDG